MTFKSVSKAHTLFVAPKFVNGVNYELIKCMPSLVA